MQVMQHTSTVYCPVLNFSELERINYVIIVYRNRISRGLYCSEWSSVVVQSAQYVWPQVEVVINTNDNYQEIRQYLS